MAAGAEGAEFPAPILFRIASAIIERAEFAVQRNKTLYGRAAIASPHATGAEDSPKRNDFGFIRCFALACCLSMIISENRRPLFGIML
jgi:hypothetical protein